MAATAERVDGGGQPNRSKPPPVGVTAVIIEDEHLSPPAKFAKKEERRGGDLGLAGIPSTALALAKPASDGRGALRRPIFFLGLAAACLLAGCTRIDSLLTDFAPGTNGAWTFRGFFDPIYPLDGLGEQRRLEILQLWLDRNSLCPRGYEIETRQVVPRTSRLGAVYYSGRCLD